MRNVFNTLAARPAAVVSSDTRRDLDCVKHSFLITLCEGRSAHFHSNGSSLPYVAFLPPNQHRGVNVGLRVTMDEKRDVALPLQGIV